MNFGSGVAISTLAVISPTSATATVNIDMRATAQANTVQVTTGSESIMLTNGFAITQSTDPNITKFQQAQNLGYLSLDSGAPGLIGDFPLGVADQVFSF